MVGHRAAHPGDGASIPDHRRHAGARRQEGAAARHRFRRRDLPAPGARRHAHGHLRAGRRALVAANRLPGISGRTFCRTIWSASRRALRSDSSISRRSSAAGIKKVVNGPFTFAPDGNPLVGPIRGLQEFLGGLRRHGRIQPGRRRGPCALALDGRRRPRARTSGAWTWRATATGRRSPTPTRRCGRIIRAASASAFRTRSCRPARPLAHHADLRALAGRARGIRRLLRRSSIRCGSRRAAQEAERRGELPALQRASARGRGVQARCATAVGLLEISNYGKFDIRGPGAAEWLSHMMANRVPRGRPHRPDADAQRARQAHRRFHAVPRRRGSCSS